VQCLEILGSLRRLLAAAPLMSWCPEYPSEAAQAGPPEGYLALDTKTRDHHFNVPYEVAGASLAQNRSAKMMPFSWVHLRDR
jgi:hypothetical protein